MQYNQGFQQRFKGKNGAGPTSKKPGEGQTSSRNGAKRVQVISKGSTGSRLSIEGPLRTAKIFKF